MCVILSARSLHRNPPVSCSVRQTWKDFISGQTKPYWQKLGAFGMPLMLWQLVNFILGPLFSHPSDTIVPKGLVQHPVDKIALLHTVIK